MKKPSFLDANNLFFSICLLLVLLRGEEMLSGDSDLGRHLTLGNYILEQWAIPTRNILSYTLALQPRPPYEWASQFLFALAYRILNLDGVIVLTALIIAFTFTLLFNHAKNRSLSILLAFTTTWLAAGAASIHWLPRPHIFTFLFLTIWVSELEKVRTGFIAHQWRFPVLMFLWANMHGGFIFGFLAWAAYGAGGFLDWRRGLVQPHAWKPFIFIGLTSLPASILTPALWGNWEAVLGNRSTFILSRTIETMPPKLSYPATGPFLALALIAILLFWSSRKTIPAGHVLLLTGFGLMAGLMARNIPLFTISATTILCELLAPKLKGFTSWSSVDARFSAYAQHSPPVLSMIVVLFMSGWFSYHWVTTRHTVFNFNPDIFPVAASEWIEEHPLEGNMFNEFNFGGYLLYRFNGRYLVFVDSQSDFYGESFLREYVAMAKANDSWETHINKYAIKWVIVPPDFALVEALKNKNWQVLYQDDTAIILRRP